MEVHYSPGSPDYSANLVENKLVTRELQRRGVEVERNLNSPPSLHLPKNGKKVAGYALAAAVGAGIGVGADRYITLESDQSSPLEPITQSQQAVPRQQVDTKFVDKAPQTTRGKLKPSAGYVEQSLDKAGPNSLSK